METAEMLQSNRAD